MNIGEKYYCSRCFAQIPKEMVCPSCGYDPDDTAAVHFLEEGTLLEHGRYQIGAPVKYDDRFCCYGAWDNQEMEPVIVMEFFPQLMISRDVTVSDEINIRHGWKKQYQRESAQFLFCRPNSSQGDSMIKDRVVHHGVGYLILKKE